MLFLELGADLLVVNQALGLEASLLIEAGERLRRVGEPDRECLQDELVADGGERLGLGGPAA
jgi:hypothetical protein